MSNTQNFIVLVDQPIVLHLEAPVKVVYGMAVRFECDWAVTVLFQHERPQLRVVPAE